MKNWIVKGNLFNSPAKKVIFTLIIICYLLSHFLASERVILGYCPSGWSFFSNDQLCEAYISPLVSMGPETILDEVDSYQAPLSLTPGIGIHLMGTDGLGRDVFSGVIHGGRKSINIAVIAAFCSIFVGWFFGMFSTFYSKIQIGLPIGIVVSGIFTAFLLVFLLVSASFGTGFFIILLVVFLMKWLIRKNVKLRPGRFISRGIEWYQALPDLLILIVLSTVVKVDSQLLVALIIALVSWPNFALLARREASEIMQQPYFIQGVRNRIPHYRLLINYLFKNSAGLLLAIIPLTIGRFVLLESTLSFLGLGLPPDIVTIGSMVNQGKDQLNAWWLIVFSGIFIFILILSLQNLGYQLILSNKVRNRNN